MNSRLNTAADGEAQAVWSDRPCGRFEVAAFTNPSDIEREWRQLESTGVATIFQRYDWVDAYARHVLPKEKATPAIVLGRLDGNPAFILPLATSTFGPVRVATWIGGNHSSYNFGLWSHEAAAVMASMRRTQIEAMLRAALDGVDYAVLRRMPRIHDDMAQPLAALSRSPSHTEGYSFALAGGFAAVLQKRNGGSRQRKIQSKERKMREAGVLEYGTVRSLERGNAALDFFFEQKALRLAEQGQLNSFGAPGVTDFFRDLLDRSRHMSEPLLEMAELRVGGKICAVIGSAIHRKRVNVYFMTFARDELAPQSPGQVLTFRQIAECCERGMAAYDLGVGFEDFKTHWCDVIHELDDAYVPLTSRGNAAIAAIQLGRAATDQLRRNPFLWQRLKWLRTYLARHAFAGNR